MILFDYKSLLPFSLSGKSPIIAILVTFQLNIQSFSRRNYFKLKYNFVASVQTFITLLEDDPLKLHVLMYKLNNMHSQSKNSNNITLILIIYYIQKSTDFASLAPLTILKVQSIQSSL